MAAAGPLSDRLKKNWKKAHEKSEALQTAELMVWLSSNIVLHYAFVLFFVWTANWIIY